MSLFLVQHGKTLPKEVDPEQSLSEEGIKEVRRIADVAKDYKVHVFGIHHSEKTRARQTAEIFFSSLQPKNGMEEKSGLKPLDDVTAVAETINNQDNLMLVGHLPFMEKLTSYLITGSSQKPVIKFQNGGIVCLDIDPATQSWVIKWTLMPNIA